MRLHIELTDSKEVVGFNHLQVIAGVINRKWLIKNEQHDLPSLYCFSWLRGGRPFRNGLRFENASFFFSAYHQDIVAQLYHGIQRDPSFAFGMNVRELVIEQPKSNDSETRRFMAASGILLKKRTEQGYEHLTYEHPDADEYLTKSYQAKLELAGISTEGASARFVPYGGEKIKLISYKGVQNKVSLCPIEAAGKAEQLAVIWGAGIGNSTGIGFGALV